MGCWSTIRVIRSVLPIHFVHEETFLPLAKNLLLYFKGSFFYSSKATSECIHSSTLQHAAKWSSLLTQTLCTRWDTHRETFPTNSHLPWSPSFHTAWMWTLTVHQSVRVFFLINYRLKADEEVIIWNTVTSAVCPSASEQQQLAV